MKSYKLVKEYPGSPLLGKIIVDTSMEFMAIQPNRYPEFWKEVPNTVAIKSEDGVDLHEGETCWIFNTNCTVTNFVISKSYLAYDSNRQVFSSKEAAEQYLIDEINIEIEDGIVSGCNIPLYSLLPKSNWDMKETTSLELWKRIKMGRNISNWLYFSSKESRDHYIRYNKPRFSLYDVQKACKGDEVPTTVFSNIINRLLSL